MAIKLSPTRDSKGLTPRKSLRLAKASHQLPPQKSLIFRGVSKQGVKVFRFHFISASEQMKERNNAYQFFSID